MYITKKKLGSKDYYYLRKSVREGEKVKSVNLAYLGRTLSEAKKKMKEFKSKEEEKTTMGEKKVVDLKKKEISVEELASFCRRRGFVYQSGEIYGSLAGFWDFGVIGVELKNNIKKEWWKYHVQRRGDIAGIDGSIITHPKTWEASGHVASFSDVYVKCKKCNRSDKIDKNEIGKVKCSSCGGELNVLGDFNLMFKTQVGPIEAESLKSYLRPETAQLIFTNFKNVLENSRMKLPFGIAQIGKAFRNEISPRDFLFRSREFEQMEIEYFIKPNQKCPDDYFKEIKNTKIKILSASMQETDKPEEVMNFSDAFQKGIIKNKWHAYWLAKEFLFFIELSCDSSNFRIRQHKKDELAHYSNDCWDLEYKFPFGWKELEGIADRSDFDLKQHEKFSGEDLKVFDEESKKKFLPFVVCEPSLGVERAFLVFMLDNYYFDSVRKNLVLKLDPKISPIKAAVFPIVKKPEFVKLSEEILNDLKKEFNVNYDISGSVGRRYSRNDEIGTPYCITIDGDSLKRQDVTIRDRDTTEQIRIKISDLKKILRKLIDKEINFSDAGKKVQTRKK